MSAYSISRKASAELRQIGRYTQKQWGVKQRRLYLSGLEQCFKMLAYNPHLARLRQNFNPPIRLYTHKHHVIAYTENDSGILIVRVMHERMDIMRQLSE